MEDSCSRIVPASASSQREGPREVSGCTLSGDAPSSLPLGKLRNTRGQMQRKGLPHRNHRAGTDRSKTTQGVLYLTRWRCQKEVVDEEAC